MSRKNVRQHYYPKGKTDRLLYCSKQNDSKHYCPKVKRTGSAAVLRKRDITQLSKEKMTSLPKRKRANSTFKRK